MPVNRQLSILPSSVLSDWAAEPDADFGEVFTKRWVVDFILDLIGYTPERDLFACTIVEPSCGSGAFLLPMVARLIASCEIFGRNVADAPDAIRAFDLLDANATLSRKSAIVQLVDSGVEQHAAEELGRSWVQVGDFLLTDHEPAWADFVVGNPPYIRLEGVPTELTDAYRKACPTMRGRSDIYVGFFEVGLDLLKPGGSLAFICADRWMHNQYGASLREFVTSKFAVDAIITMHDVAAFEDDVSAYPAITVLRNDIQRAAHVVDASKNFGEKDANAISSWVNGNQRRTPTSKGFQACRLDTWHQGPGLWPAGSPSQLALIADLERRFAPLESRATGTRVGIGVATGCDDVYITRRSDLVEEDRLLPLLRAGDLATGEPVWSGHYLVNPWEGRELVDLAAHPRLRRHFEAHSDRLRVRHTAKKQPARWYRTIDAIDPTLLARPKLVLPDMKAAAHPVLDRGEFYPHHNLYYVVSDGWDLEVLGGILLSDVANLFVGAYCVKMRGGCYRFQAQYVRQIRVPEPDRVTPDLARSLADAFRRRDRLAATSAAADLYGIDVRALGLHPAA